MEVVSFQFKASLLKDKSGESEWSCYHTTEYSGRRDFSVLYCLFRIDHRAIREDGKSNGTCACIGSWTMPLKNIKL